MASFVCLLRGINVGGRHALKMADLRAMLGEAGYVDVQTYIQSGNVVLAHPKLAAAAAQADLHDRISALAGFDVPVMVRTAAQWAKVLDADPLGGDRAHAHVLFLDEPPARAALAEVDGERFAPEAFAVVGREVYLQLPAGMGRAKLPVALGRALPPTTARNWRTIERLAALLEG